MKRETVTDSLGAVYVQPVHLTEKFSISRTTV